MSLETSVAREGDRVVVSLRGDLDVSAVPVADAALGDAEADGPRELVLDLRELAFIDSSGIRVLLKTLDRSKREGRELVLSEPSDYVRRLLEMMQLERRFRIEPGGAAGASGAAAVEPAPNEEATDAIGTGEAAAPEGADGTGRGGQALAAVDRHEAELPCDERAPGLARRLLERFEALPAALLQDLELLTSEVVTNAVRYGCREDGQRVRVVMEHRQERVRVSVVDPGTGVPPVATDLPPERESGWGLYLVDLLSTRWGTDTDPSSVWFEIEISAN